MSNVSVNVSGPQVGVAVSGGESGSISVSSSAMAVSATVGVQGVPFHTHATSEIVGLQSSLAAKASLSGATFTGSVGLNSGWAIGGVAVTASADEINLLDGVASGAILADKAVVYDSTGGIFADFVLAYNGFFVNDGYTDYFGVSSTGAVNAASINLSGGATLGGNLTVSGSLTINGSTAPTAPADTNTTQIATTAFVVGQGYLKSSAAAATYQPIDADLTAIASLATSANTVPYFTGASAASLASLTAFGRSLIDDIDAAEVRATIGLSTMALQDHDSVSITGGTIDSITIDGGTW